VALGSEAARLFVSVGADIGEFQREMARADNGIRKFAGVGKAALIGATATMGAAIVGFGMKSSQVAADFEAQMNVLAVAARSSGTALGDLRQAAVAVGADTELVGISASEAADAMTNFYKAGLNTKQIFGDLQGYLEGTTSLSGALRAAVDLAAASELDLAQASDVVAVSMATFNLSAEQATQIANNFVGAADASVASVADLAEALQNVGPTSAAMGLSLEETNTALAILSTRGIRGAEAGTALKSMFANLLSPTKKTQEALLELGVSLFDAQGKMLPMRDIIAQLSTSFAGLTDKQKQQYAQTLAGTYGMKALQTLLAEGVQGWDDMTQAIANAATAQEVANARTKGLSAAWEQLQGSLEALMINVGTPLIENFLTPMVQRLTEWIGVLAEAVPSSDQLRDALVRFRDEVGSLLSTLSPVIEQIGSWFGTVIPQAVEILRTGWETAWTGMQAVVSTAQQMIGPLVETIRGWLQEAIPQAVDVLFGVWQEVWGVLAPRVQQAVEVMAPLVEQIRGWLGSVLPAAVGIWQSAFETVWGAVGQVVASVWEGMAPTLEAMLSFLETTIPTALAALQGIWESVWPAVQAALSTAWTTIQSVLAEAKVWLEANLPTALSVLQEQWNVAWGGLQNALQSTWSAMQPVLEQIRSWFSQEGLASSVIQTQTMFSEAVGRMQEVWGLLAEYFGPTVDRIITAFQDMIAEFAKMGPEFQALWEAARPVLEPLAKLLGTTLVIAVKLFGETLAAIMGAVPTVVGSVVRSATVFFTTLRTVFEEVVAAIKALIEGDYSVALEHAKQAIKAMADGAIAILGNFLKMETAIITSLFQAIVNTFADLPGEAGQKFQEMYDAAKIKMDNLLATVRQMLYNVRSAISNFSLHGVGAALIDSMISGVKSKAAALASAAKGVVSSAISAAKAALGMHSPSRVFIEIGENTMLGFAIGIKRGAKRVRDALSVSLKVSSTDDVSAFSEIVEALDKAVDNLVGMQDALRRWRLSPGWYRRAREVFEAAMRMMDLVVETADAYVGDGLKKARILIEAVPKVVDAIGGVVSYLDDLRRFRAPTYVRRTTREIVEFAGWLIDAVSAMARDFSEMGLAASRKFMAAVGDMVSGLGDALDLLGRLRFYVNVRGTGNIRRFMRDVQGVVFAIRNWVLRQFPHLSTSLIDAWGNAIGSLADGLGSALDLLGGLHEYVNVRGTGNIRRFMRDVQGLVFAIRNWVLQQFPRLSTELIDAWGGAIGSLAGGLGSALDLLGGLHEYVNVRGTGNIRRFMRDVQGLMFAFRNWILSQFQRMSTDLMEQWGGAIGSLADGLGSTLDLLRGLVTYVAPSEAAIAAFMDGVRQVVARAYQFVVTQLSNEVLDTVGAFGEALGSLASGLGDMLRLFQDLMDTNLAGWLAGPNGGVVGSAFDRQLQAFNLALLRAINSWRDWIINTLDPQAAELVANFSDVLQRIVGGFQAALSFLSDLGGTTMPTLDQIQAFMQAVLDLFRAFADALGDQAASFYEAGAAMMRGLARGLADFALYPSVPGSVAQIAQQAGQAIGQGLATGMSDALDEVTNEAAIMAREAAKMAQHELGVSSPSRVFVEIGRALPEGLALGIRQRMGAASQALRDLMPGSGMPAFALAGGGYGGNVYNVDVHVQGGDRDSAEALARAIVREMVQAGVRLR